MSKTAQAKALVLEQFKKTPIMQIVCEKCDVSRMTIHRWKKDDPAFAKALTEAMQDGRHMVNDLAESQLVSAVKDRNLHAIMYWLRHHHADYKAKVEVSGTVQVRREMTAEEKKEIERVAELVKLPPPETYGI